MFGCLEVGGFKRRLGVKLLWQPPKRPSFNSIRRQFGEFDLKHQTTMAQSQTAAVIIRERYLGRAALLLQDTDEAIANECRHNAQNLQKLVKSTSSNVTDTQQCCSACGSTALETRVALVKTKRETSRRTDAVKHEDFDLRLSKCQSCFRTTKKRRRKSLSESTAVQVDAPATSHLKTDTSPGPQSDPSRNLSTKPSNKKRAKERKNREGLQAMLLNESKNTASKSASFDLMNFMSRSK